MKHVLILYEDPLLRGHGYFHGVHLANLLGASPDVEITRLPARRYRSGMHGAYDRTFYVGGSWPRRRRELARDATGGAAITCLGGGLDRGSLARLGIELRGGKRPKTLTVEYADARFVRDPEHAQRLQVVEAVDPAVRTHAWAVRPDGKRSAYVVQRDDFWYFADDPFLRAHERDRYLVLADLVPAMLGDETRHPPRALLRLEDLSPRAEPAALRTTLDVLERSAIPFIMCVVPGFGDGTREWSWNENQEAVAQLIRGERLGGRVFQHGYTHRYGTLKNPTGTSLLDWEFWDETRKRPIAGFRNGEALERVERGRDVLREIGLSPVGWVTPHYMASEPCYAEFAEVYGLFCERRPYFRRSSHLPQFFPHPVRDTTGARILPENLGYVHGARSLDAIVGGAKLNLALRRPWASWYVHPYLLHAPAHEGGVRPEELGDAIDRIQAMGYRFVDPVGVFDEDARPPASGRGPDAS